jgi:hypothetical protein
VTDGKKFIAQIILFIHKKSKKVKISEKKFSFFSTPNQYFLHIPYVASKNMEIQMNFQNFTLKVKKPKLSMFLYLGKLITQLTKAEYTSSSWMLLQTHDLWLGTWTSQVSFSRGQFISW